MSKRERFEHCGVEVELFYSETSKDYHVHYVEEHGLSATGATRQEALDGFTKRLAREQDEIERALSSSKRLRGLRRKAAPKLFTGNQESDDA